jgi:hypothetical protein
MPDKSLRRPAYISMPNAVRAAILFENRLSDIDVCAWAKTYGCEPSEIQAAWEAELTRQSQQPQNVCEIPEGK